MLLHAGRQEKCEGLAGCLLACRKVGSSWALSVIVLPVCKFFRGFRCVLLSTASSYLPTHVLNCGITESVSYYLQRGNSKVKNAFNKTSQT
jgi:hypothetical protein